MPALICSTCKGKGFYMDRVCEKGACAHAGRKLSSARRKELREAAPDVIPPRRTGRVMPCPQRPCACASGTRARKRMRLSLQLQEERIKASGRRSP